jgi:feruloyl esterase
MTRSRAPRLLAAIILATMLALGGEAPSAAQALDDRTSEERAADGLAFLWRLEAPGLPDPITDARPVRPCEDLIRTDLNGYAIVSAQTVPATRDRPPWCRVSVELRRRAAPNVTTIWIALPLERWNGRYVGLGGGHYLAGAPASLLNAVRYGFAAAATDAGHAYAVDADLEQLLGVADDASFVRNGDGELDWLAIRNFGYLGIHDMTLAAKSLITTFYGRAPRYSYFTGCSTGGRQGQAEIQRYPDDYDGVLSGAPALYGSNRAATAMWPLAVGASGVTQCKFDAARHAAIASCDANDGAADGLVQSACAYSAHALIGVETPCGVFSREDARIIDLLWDGPRRESGESIWYGVDRTVAIQTPTLPASPSPLLTGWSPASQSSLSPSGLELMFDQLREQYGAVLDTADPDIGQFVDRGGKTIIWHGASDEAFPAAGSDHYVRAIEHTIGRRRMNAAVRYYLAPGVGHCEGGEGPQPIGLLAALIAWVEHNRAPALLRSENRNNDGQVVRTRPLCPYPRRSHYRGRGSLDEAANFVCR